ELHMAPHVSKLLIDEYPLVILPGLAVAIGLNEAILLQQVHYWLMKTKHVHDSVPWIYNSYDAWKTQFPFWSRSTIIRSIQSLESMGLLKRGNFNKRGFDHTKWYTIDYQELERRSTHFEQTTYSKRVDDQLTLSSAIPETSSETTQRKEASAAIE